MLNSEEEQLPQAAAVGKGIVGEARPWPNLEDGEDLNVEER
jgi:hypothetical protein